MPAEKPPPTEGDKRRHVNKYRRLLTGDNPNHLRSPNTSHPTTHTAIPSETDDSVVLGFSEPQSWASAYKSCESSIIQQCEAGVRIGCSVSASSKCRKFKEELVREKCEEREMAECFEASIKNCRKFVEEKCFPAFRDTRIVVKGGCGDEKKKKKCVSELIGRVCMSEKMVGDLELWRLKGFWSKVKSRIGFTILRGSDLLDKQPEKLP